MICGSTFTPRTRFLSFNRKQFRVVIGLFTGHDAMRRYLPLMGLIGDHFFRKCAAEEETSDQA
jgi:hypothetical protein